MRAIVLIAIALMIPVAAVAGDEGLYWRVEKFSCHYILKASKLRYPHEDGVLVESINAYLGQTDRFDGRNIATFGDPCETLGYVYAACLHRPDYTVEQALDDAFRKMKHHGRPWYLGPFPAC